MKRYHYFLRSTILTAALGLMMSASAKPPTGIPITSLPFTITAPGTYVLESDLSFSVPLGSPGIIIATNIPGPVILNLRGHTISGSNGAVGIGIGSFAGAAGGNTYPITVRNGSITNVGWGVWVEQVSAISNITVENLSITCTFSSAYTSVGILFSEVNNSVISNCSISQSDYGIEDGLSAGGNHFSSVVFNNVGETLFVDPAQYAIHTTLQDYQESAPAP
jgi:hypothetical protein